MRCLVDIEWLLIRRLSQRSVFLAILGLAVIVLCVHVLPDDWHHQVRGKPFHGGYTGPFRDDHTKLGERLKTPGNYTLTEFYADKLKMNHSHARNIVQRAGESSVLGDNVYPFSPATGPPSSRQATRLSSKMFTFSEILENRRYFDVAVVRFAEIVFCDPVSRHCRLDVLDQKLFEALLIDAKETDACLDFIPFAGEVWELGDFYYSTYPGYARYRDLYFHNYARLLWWMESGEDVYHPHSRRSDFYPEILYSSVESRLEARLEALEALNSLRSEDAAN
ncbi:hypothetical protein OUZ56_017583 [Daphnia magna]|uniref:Uncharacterized protein n=1 Tax=Daphnia magna TaxID=35525 RepID=A0ABR0ATM6_9CRUS|nr:hypothetical protein OUZ56_017583 [Daphnia magna]